MKKILALLLAIVMSVGIFVACGQTKEGTEGNTEVNAIFKDVKPLKERTELRIGMLAGGSYAAIFKIIEQFGGFEKANIDVSYATFANGGLLVEAMDSWDISIYGSGGIYGGTQKDGHVLMGTPFHNSGFKLFVRKDSPIALAGNTVSAQPTLLGDAESWRGAEVLLPTGTTLHAFLQYCLAYFSLTDADVQLTHMDVANVNTAFRAGTGDVGGFWPPQSSQSDLEEKFVRAAFSNEMGYETPCDIAANKNSYNDPKITKAIEKTIELYFRTIDWVLSSDEAFNQAAEIYNDWNQEEGANSTVEECKDSMKTCPFFTLNEAIAQFETKVVVDGKTMSVHQQMDYMPLKLFVSLGKYDASLLDKMLDKDLHNIEYLYSARKAMYGK